MYFNFLSDTSCIDHISSGILTGFILVKAKETLGIHVKYEREIKLQSSPSPVTESEEK